MMPALLAASAPAGHLALFFAAVFLIDVTAKAFVGVAYAHLTRRPLRIVLYQVAAAVCTFVPLAAVFAFTPHLDGPLAQGLAQILSLLLEALILYALAGRKVLPLRAALALSALATAASALVGLLASSL